MFSAVSGYGGRILCKIPSFAQVYAVDPVLLIPLLIVCAR